MNPREFYAARIAHWTARRAADERASIRLSRLRLISFLLGAAALWAGFHFASPPFFALAALAAVVFSALVVAHARRLDAVARADAALAVNARGGARLDRHWAALPAVVVPADIDEHAYARDLDVVGQASLLQWLGPTATHAGSERLQSWLLAPAPPETIAARQHAIQELGPKAEWREALLTDGATQVVPAQHIERLLQWAESTGSAVPSGLPLLIPLLTALTLVPLALQQIGWMPYAWWLAPMLIGIILSFALAGRIYRAFDSVSLGERALSHYGRMLALVEREAWTSPSLRSALSRVQEPAGRASEIIGRLAALANWSEARRSAALLHFPLQALTLWDFHVLFALERWRRRYGRHLRGVFDALGEIDALSTLAAIRHDEPDWCMPLVTTAAPTVTGTALGHPLIAAAHRVSNDVTIGPPGSLLLITGSNMSGKSTLLRAIGLNLVLAQAGAPVCAEALTLPPCDLETSIRVQDSLERGLSYFMAALARLKRIVDAAERRADGPRIMLYLLDEVLQGTNSAERAIAVRAIARHLLDAGAIGAMTTHDLGVAGEEPFASHARLVHFTEQVHPDGTMTFDYRLRDGLATSRNALRLMRLMGIDPA